MAELPQSQHSIVALIDQYHESKSDKTRPHLGCSMLGHHCDRWLWLSFRWAVIEKFQGRMLRLFRRGHLEESNIVSDLRAIGIEIHSTEGGQSRVAFGSHVSGSLDGIIESGVPESPEKRHIAEFKTHSKKSFDALIKDGVQKSKPTHWAQMQVYMLGKDIDRALYVAVCKDDDRLYTERVKLEKAEAEKLIERGKRIATSDRLPESCAGASADWYQCKFCPAHSFCHGDKLTKQVNCRTCAHSTALPSSEWHCQKWDAIIPNDAQYDGCESHVLHPDLVPWQLDGVNSTMTEAVYIVDGVPVRNGEADAFTFSSRELVKDASACAATVSGGNAAAEVRRNFPGALANAS